MPKLRRLSGGEVIKILQGLGFRIVRTRGSHFILSLDACMVIVPAHGHDPLALGTLKQIYNDALICVPEEKLRPLFYTN